MPKTILLLFLLVCSTVLSAQQHRICRVSFAYRVFELDTFGNNPRTVAPLLQDQQRYQNYINSFFINTAYGNPGILRLRHFAWGAEWAGGKGRFWEKHAVPFELLLTSRTSTSAGAVGNEDARLQPDTVVFRNLYGLTKQLQFIGASAGLLRRLHISKKIAFVTGLRVIGSRSLVHRYQPRWDSIEYRPSQPSLVRTTLLPELKGLHAVSMAGDDPAGGRSECLEPVGVSAGR